MQVQIYITWMYHVLGQTSEASLSREQILKQIEDWKKNSCFPTGHVQQGTRLTKQDKCKNCQNHITSLFQFIIPGNALDAVTSIQKHGQLPLNPLQPWVLMPGRLWEIAYSFLSLHFMVRNNLHFIKTLNGLCVELCLNVDLDGWCCDCLLLVFG